MPSCSQCGMHTENYAEFHPFLYCELFKAGHHDPESYLRLYGFTRTHHMSVGKHPGSPLTCDPRKVARRDRTAAKA